MKAISMWQPHGSLLTTGAKPYETRSWSTKFRGPILIHAAQHFVRSEFEEILNSRRYRMGLAPLVGQPMDFSKWVFMVKDGEIHAGVPTPTPEQIWIDVESFIEAVPRGAFIGMADVKRFKTPIPAKGHQGFFYASVNLADNELISVL